MSSGHIPERLVRLVRQRAGNVCEYCRLPQWSQEATFHVDHIRPRSAGGPTNAMNLALACVTCSLRKAARVSVRDPGSGLHVPIFNPRIDVWPDHFAWTGTWRVIGRTPKGRATALALGMNRRAVVVIRRRLVAMGWSPAE